MLNKKVIMLYLWMLLPAINYLCAGNNNPINLFFFNCFFYQALLFITFKLQGDLFFPINDYTIAFIDIHKPVKLRYHKPIIVMCFVTVIPLLIVNGLSFSNIMLSLFLFLFMVYEYLHVYLCCNFKRKKIISEQLPFLLVLLIFKVPVNLDGIFFLFLNIILIFLIFKVHYHYNNRKIEFIINEQAIPTFINDILFTV